MGKKARTICQYHNCGRKVEVGNRSIHLVEEHKLIPPEKWLKKHRLARDIKIIADAMKNDENLRPPYRWTYRYFDFPGRQ